LSERLGVATNDILCEKSQKQEKTPILEIYWRLSKVRMCKEEMSIMQTKRLNV